MTEIRKPLSFAEQRRRKQRAAAIKQQRQAQQPAQPAQAKTVEVKPVDEPQTQTSAVVAVAAAVVAAAAAMTTIGMGLPVWGHGWQPGWLLPAGSVTVAAAAVTGRHRTACSTKLQGAVGTVAAMLLAAFVWGAATSIVIDGEVVADTSDIAGAWKLTQKASDDLATIRNYDELLTIDVPQARSRFNEYEAAETVLRRISAQWAATDPGKLPDPQFIDLARAVASAANFNGDAVAGRARLLIEANSAAEATMRNNAAFARQQAVAAHQHLSSVKQLFGFDAAAEPETS